METQMTEPVVVEQEESSTLPEWRAPEITRIELKRTMLGSGTASDGGGFAFV